MHTYPTQRPSAQHSTANFSTSSRLVFPFIVDIAHGFKPRRPQPLLALELHTVSIIQSINPFMDGWICKLKDQISSGTPPRKAILVYMKLVVGFYHYAIKYVPKYVPVPELERCSRSPSLCAGLGWNPTLSHEHPCALCTFIYIWIYR